ncbi:MAG: CoA-binding protein [Roseitalea sp.]|uniref:CoA-binding protein n=1 Tax=Oceaniradius stylonematis TaxID=2184161 RepID=UPI001B19E970|nr:CoA-binding protein [Roseitalea sp.]MBO6951208.1 CoA-binding protein [Rhizobiaceae bacterium]MBO6590805.1 CoA-binding protein [Roseitalea sp.]MBO6599937.1 CoA-binding protein [Roseitalea sp.]MBO6611693.1 CoA-binding protein [Roseitalea sp.]
MNHAQNHDAYPDELIRSVLTSVKSIAVVGASPNPARSSHGVTGFLVRKGFTVFAVNPGHAGKTIAGAPTVGALADLPQPVDMIDVFRRSEHLGAVVDAALALDPLPKVIWSQLGVRDDIAAARAEAAGLTVIQDRCPAIEMPRLGL